jgi:hypothetical protein
MRVVFQNQQLVLMMMRTEARATGQGGLEGLKESKEPKEWKRTKEK